MSKKKYEERNIQAIAEAIREKTGSEQTYKTEDMASGVSEVYDAGKQEAETELWANIHPQQMNTGENLFYMWNWEYMKIPYKIIVKNAGTTLGLRTFYSNKKLKKVESKYFWIDNHSTVSSTEEYGYNQMFYSCSELEEIEDINFQAGHPYKQSFYNCKKLHTIAKIRSDKQYTKYNNTFRTCNSLKNIRFEGEIGQSISFSYSPLTVESMKNIVTCLYDYSGTTSEYKYTVTFSSACKEALEAEGATAEYNGTPCTWLELIEYKKWNG